MRLWPTITIHACMLDPECRRVDAPPRLHVIGMGWNLGIALAPSARFVARDRSLRWISLERIP